MPLKFGVDRSHWAGSRRQVCSSGQGDWRNWSRCLVPASFPQIQPLPPGGRRRAPSRFQSQPHYPQSLRAGRGRVSALYPLCGCEPVTYTSQSFLFCKMGTVTGFILKPRSLVSGLERQPAHRDPHS